MNLSQYSIIGREASIEKKTDSVWYRIGDISLIKSIFK